MISLDTNVLVRILVDDPGAMRQCQAARARLETEPSALISSIVQAELIWVLESSYGLNKSELVDVLEQLRDNTAYRLQARETFVEAVARYREGTAGFVDYLILVTATSHDTQLLTFDKKLARSRGGELLASH